MAMSKHQRAALTDISTKMRGMTAEMRAFADGRAQPKMQTSAPTPSGRPAQLQFNTSGSWRSGPDFDAGEVPDEFLQAADSLGRLSGRQMGMRIVICIPNGSGGTIASRNVLMHWTRETGWVKA